MKLLKESIASSNTEKLMDKITKALTAAKIYPDIWPTGKNSFSVYISWGDWKHDHLYADKIIEDTLGDINFNIEKEITEEDGTDTYSAIHNVTIYPSKANLDELKESIDKKHLDFIKEMAQEHWDIGHPFDPDDYSEFAKIVRECGFKPSKALFDKYFEIFDEIRSEELQDDLFENLDKSSLKQEIKDTIREFYPNLSDEDYNDLIGDYLVVEIKEENDRTKVEVRAELSYTQMDKLANKLDPIIQKYDDSAYFDHEDAGIISAYIKTDAYRKKYQKYENKIVNNKSRIIWDDCTPTLDRRPTTAEDIENDIHVRDFGNPSEILEFLEDLADREADGNTYEEKLEDILTAFEDSGDGSPNIIYLSINGQEVDGTYIYDCLKHLNLSTATEEEVKDAMLSEIDDDDSKFYKIYRAVDNDPDNLELVDNASNIVTAFDKMMGDATEYGEDTFVKEPNKEDLLDQNEFADKVFEYGKYLINKEKVASLDKLELSELSSIKNLLNPLGYDFDYLYESKAIDEEASDFVLIIRENDIEFYDYYEQYEADSHIEELEDLDKDNLFNEDILGYARLMRDDEGLIICTDKVCFYDAPSLEKKVDDAIKQFIDKE